MEAYVCTAAEQRTGTQRISSVLRHMYLKHCAPVCMVALPKLDFSADTCAKEQKPK